MSEVTMTDIETVREHLHRTCITVGVNADERCIEVREALSRIEQDIEATERVAEDGWAWVEKALAAGGWETVFDIPESPKLEVSSE